MAGVSFEVAWLEGEDWFGLALLPPVIVRWEEGMRATARVPLPL